MDRIVKCIIADGSRSVGLPVLGHDPLSPEVVKPLNCDLRSRLVLLLVPKVGFFLLSPFFASPPPYYYEEDDNDYDDKDHTNLYRVCSANCRSKETDTYKC